MIIFRAGLTGCLAACINPDATILDTDSAPTFHKAVLRFRSDDVSKATGIPFQKIKVTKALFDTTEWCFTAWTPKSANEYSKKVIGGIHNRSIDSLEPVTRWLAPDNFHEQLLDMIGNRVMWGEQYTPFTKGPKISTLAMPQLLSLVDQDDIINLQTDYNSIYVNTIRIDEPCDINQTVYIPNVDNPIYRMTLEGQKLIVESTEELDEDDIFELPQSVFGIDEDKWEITDKNYKQKIGKIAPVRDDLRKELIYKLTQDHDIYSLGRTAIWKSILLDDCLQDINRINAMISKSKYERMLGI